MTEAVLPDAHVTRGPRAENHRLVREKKNKYRISPSHAWSHLAEQRHNDTNTVCHRMESDEASCGLLLDKKLLHSCRCLWNCTWLKYLQYRKYLKISRIVRHTEEAWDCDV